MIDKVWALFGCNHLYGDFIEGRTSWRLHFIVLAQFVRYTRRNPQKSQANPVPKPKKIIKERKVMQKGASGSGKPKEYSISIQENLAIEQIHVESIASNTSSEEKISKIHKAPYSLGSPFVVSPKETSPPIHHTPLFLSVTPQPSIIQTSGTLIATTVMAAPTKMERIIAARY